MIDCENKSIEIEGHTINFNWREKHHEGNVLVIQDTLITPHTGAKIKIEVKGMKNQEVQIETKDIGDGMD